MPTVSLWVAEGPLAGQSRRLVSQMNPVKRGVDEEETALSASPWCPPVTLVPPPWQLWSVCSITVPTSCHTTSSLSLWPIHSSVGEKLGGFIITIRNVGKQYFNQKISPARLCCQTPLPRAVFEEYIGSNWIFPSPEQFVPRCSAGAVWHF